MDLDEVKQDLLAEAGKMIMLQVFGVSTKAGKRLVALVRRKARDVPPDRAEIERLLFAEAHRDPVWLAEIAQVVQAMHTGQPVLACGLPPDPFCDRAGPLAGVPDYGVYVIAGRHGSGARSLALKIAWDRRDQFPGGRIAVELDKFRDEQGHLSATAVQRYVLDLCEISGEDQADSADGIARQVRSQLATRRILLILMEARIADEIAPYQPVLQSNLVLVVTRNLAEDLREPGKSTLLGGMDKDGAWELLEKLCPDLVAAEPSGAWELLEMCDYLPEPIRWVGGRLQAHQHRVKPISSMVTRLRSRGLANASGIIKDSVDQTFRELTPEARAACVALARHPGYDFDLGSVGALLGHDSDDAIDRLGDAGLLTPTAPGRQRLHYVVRGYVLDLGQDDSVGFRRVLDFLRDCALYADGEPNRLRVYPAGHGSDRPPADTDPVDYLYAQRHVLLDLAWQAQQRGMHTEVCQLGGALEVLVNKHGCYEWYAALNEIVLVSAHARLDDLDDDDRRAMVARAHAMQGRMYFLRHIIDRAEIELRLASDALSGLRDRRPQLESSVAEFWGRCHEIRAEQPHLTEAERHADLGLAIGFLTEALRIDRETRDDRAILIHARMLANMLITAGRPGEAWPLLDEAERSAGTPGRNLARVHMVRAWAALRSGLPERMRHELERARTLLDTDGVTHYGWEFSELEAELARLTGLVEKARELWGGLAEAAILISHPKAYRYLAELERLPRR